MHNRSIRRIGDIGVERIFDKNNGKIFLILIKKKHTNLHSQDVQQTPKKMSTKNFTLKYIILSTESQRESRKHTKDGTLYVQGSSTSNKETADLSF